MVSRYQQVRKSDGLLFGYIPSPLGNISCPIVRTTQTSPAYLSEAPPAILSSCYRDIFSAVLLCVGLYLRSTYHDMTRSNHFFQTNNTIRHSHSHILSELYWSSWRVETAWNGALRYHYARGSLRVRCTSSPSSPTDGMLRLGLAETPEYDEDSCSSHRTRSIDILGEVGQYHVPGHTSD
jgi:hypothetical protein